MNPFLRELREQDWFKKFVKDLAANEAPTILPYSPEDPHSVERWKSDSFRREGFILALTKFGFSLEELSGD